MNLDTQNWQGFKLEDLFSRFERGKANQTMLEEGSGVFYVGAKRNNNGVMIHCAYDKSVMSKGNCIVFISNGQGSVGYANYMNIDFIASTDLILGYADWLNEPIGLFLATVFSLERPKYSFGRKWGRFLRETIVDLPIQRDNYGNPVNDPDKVFSPEGYIPDWQFMEDFIHSLHHKPITTRNQARSTPLRTDDWEFFFLKDLCSIDMGNKLDFSAVPSDNPEVNFVGRSADNNGVMGKVDKIPNLNPYPAGELTVALGGSLGSTFLQTEPFYTSQNVSVLHFDTKLVSVPARLFLANMIQFESRFKYFPFGRELNKYIRTIYGFDLPVQRDEQGRPVIDLDKRFHKNGYVPDWGFMERYIRALPYGDRIPDISLGAEENA